MKKVGHENSLFLPFRVFTENFAPVGRIPNDVVVNIFNGMSIVQKPPLSLQTFGQVSENLFSKIKPESMSFQRIDIFLCI